MSTRAWQAFTVGIAGLWLLGAAGCGSSEPASAPADGEVSRNAVSVARLETESMTTPLGIDQAQPRLSWQLRGERRGILQRAYRVRVASSPALLAAGAADIWDSGRVQSAQPHAELTEVALQSRTRYHWTVQVWDETGTASTEAPATWFETAFLDAADWQAQWIQLDRGALQRVAIDLLSLPAGPFSPHGYLFLIQFLVTSSEFQASAPEAVKTLLERLGAPFVNGALQTPELYQTPAPYLRKAFALDQPVVRARIYSTAMGLYEIEINGRRVGEDVLAPGWTDYDRRVQYQTYDVTEHLTQGANAIGVRLSDGWYSGHVGFWGPRLYGNEPALRLQLEIEYADGTRTTVASDESWAGLIGGIRRADLLHGEHFDARLEPQGWSTAAFDDSRLPRVLARSGIELKRDLRSILRDFRLPPERQLSAQIGAPPRVVGERKPVAMTQPQPGVYIFDLGQNLAGRMRITATGPAGTEIHLRHGERLNDDGTLYTGNLRAARAEDVFVLAGTGSEEIYEPRFTTHGFQFIEVTGYPGTPTLDVLTARIVSSVDTVIGGVETSDPMLNQLWSNLQWSARANYISVPTDTPSRDERMGWAGDAQLFARTGALNFDLRRFLGKWMQDVRDAQRKDGVIPHVVPDVFFGCNCQPVPRLFSGVNVWADAVVIVPWELYRLHGDRRYIDDNWDAMVAWIDQQESTARNDGTRGAGPVDFGDWLSLESTDTALVNSAYFARTTQLMAKMARATGRSNEATRYQALHERIRAGFIARFLDDDSRLKGDTQSAYAMALRFGLVPEERRAQLLARFRESLARHDNHVATGIAGTRELLPALTENGERDLAFQLLTNRDFPSWGYPITELGATTIWERWDGYHPARGFQNEAMNSFNHYVLGTVGEWMMETLAGLSTDDNAAGFERLVIRPEPGPGVDHASAWYESVRGRVETAWRQHQDRFELDLRVPANVIARVHVPALSPDHVSEQGLVRAQPAQLASGVRLIGMEDDRVVYEVGSGSYRFVAER